MSGWLVTQDNAQFAVDDLDALKRLAASGDLDAADMVQRPGDTSWLYASEVPELEALLASPHDTLDDEDLDWRPRRGLGAMGTAAVAVILLGVLAVGSLAMVFFYSQLPTENDGLLGEQGLTYSEMLVTEPAAPLYRQADTGSAVVTEIDKDTTLELLAKRGDFYQARTPGGEEGWIAVDQVLPMYMLGGGEVMAEYDPLYNPDRYVEVRNATWLQIDEDNAQLTVFRFQLENDSRYPMTDLVLLATIKDAKGNELERVEIPVEGVLPAGQDTMVGTLAPPSDAPDTEGRSLTSYTFSQLAETDPDLQLLYSDGIEVEMSTEDFTEAQIDLLQVRAMPLQDGTAEG